MNNNLENDLIYSGASSAIKKKMEQRILTQKEYIAELFRQQHFSIDTIPQELIERLSYYINTFTELLKTRGKDLRKAQIDSLEAIITHLKKSKFKGLIKLPTGTGKTRLFTEVIGALNMPSVVLIPRTSLKGQTMDEFIDHDVIDNKRVFLIGDKESKEKGAVSELRNALDTAEQNHITNPIILITYQSLLSVKRSDSELFDRFRKLIQCIIRDEAHRSIGDETSEVLQELKRLEEGFDESDKKLELLLTATPKLLAKDIRDSYETIISIRTQEVVEQGDLIMPRRKPVGKAYVNADTENITEEFLKANSLKFVDEHGIPIYKRIISAYKEEKAKQPNGYLPFVAFCSTIEQAEFIKGELEKEGIRTCRVTSGNSNYDKGVSEDDAKIMLVENEIDGVSTVAKVAEGWDVKTLRCALHFCPIRSEAKYIQGTGRIMRTLPENELNSTVGMTSKSIENTLIIEPDIWYVGSNYTDEVDGSESKSRGSNGSGGEENKQNILTSISGLGHFINSGEFDEGFLEQHYGSLEEYDAFRDLEEIDENGRVVIDEIEYQRVGPTTPSQQLWGMSPWIATNDVKSQTDSWKKKYMKTAKANRIAVNIIEVQALEALIKSKLEKSWIGENGRTFIEGKEYQWVGYATPATQLWGIQGFTAVGRIKKQDDAWKELYVKEARSKKGILTVVEVKALENLLKDDGELPLIGENGKVSIEGIPYQWLGTTTPKEQLRGVSPAVAANRVNAQSAERKKKNIKRAKAVTGIIQVINEAELEKLVKHVGEAPVLNEKGRVIIEGKEYQWIGTRTPIQQLRGVNGAVAKYKIEQQSDERKKLYVKEAKSAKKGMVMVVQIDELEKLIKQLGDLPSVNDEGRVTIEGAEYQWIGPTTPSDQLWGMNGFTANRKVLEQGLDWRNKYMKTAKSTGKIVNVVAIKQLKELIEEEASLLELDENGRVNIEGVIYQRVGPTTPAAQLWGMKGNAAQTRINQQPEEWKTKNMKKAKYSVGICRVFELSALEKLIKEDAELPELKDKGRVMIEGKEYQWVGPTTSSEWLWGVNTSFVNKIIKAQSSERKDLHMKTAKSITGIVKVFELKTLEELLKEYIGLPQVGEDYKVAIAGKNYLYISRNLSSELLWGMNAQLAQKRVNAQSEERKKCYVKKVFINGKLEEVVELSELEKLIKEEAQIPKINDNGRVLIEDKEYQWVGWETPAHMIWGLSGRALWKVVIKQGDARMKLYVKDAKRGSRAIQVVELRELEKIKDQ